MKVSTTFNTGKLMHVCKQLTMRRLLLGGKKEGREESKS